MHLQKIQNLFLSQLLLGREAERQFYNNEVRTRRQRSRLIQNAHKTFNLSTLSYITSAEETSRVSLPESSGMRAAGSAPADAQRRRAARSSEIKLAVLSLLPRSMDIRSVQCFSLCSVFRANI